MREIKGKTIFINGVDQGIGMWLVDECVARGAKKIYAAGITFYKLLPLLDLYPGVVVPIVLDLSDPEVIKKRTASCGDVNFLINKMYIPVKLTTSFRGKVTSYFAGEAF